MNFPPLHDGCTSGRATPFLRRNHHAATHTKTTNLAETHLTFAENCSNNRGQLSCAVGLAIGANQGKIAFADNFFEETG